MSTEAAAATPPRHLPRSIGAVAAGMLAIIALSLLTDELLHLAGIYPPWSEAMPQPGLNLLALGYRCVFNVLGAYLTARLAPRHPARHLWALASIGFALGTAGAIVTAPLKLGPAWYPLLLAVSAWPCTWLGWRAFRALAPRAPA